jgi:hypothetical protein
MPRNFNLEDVLSVTTGILMGPVGGVYKVCDFVTGESNFTHQLGRASQDIKPFIFYQHPELQDIHLEEMGVSTVPAVLADLKSKYGETLELKSLSEMGVEYKGQDPMEELGSMVDPSKIIVVNLGKNSENP